MNLFKLTIKSMKYRKVSVLLTFLSLTLGCALLFSINTLQSSVKSSFESSITDIDLIIGAANSPVSLMLSAVFRIGYPRKNIDYSLFESLKKDQRINWTIPISLGDSHKGYKVIATTKDFFNYYSIRSKKSIKFKKGSLSGFSNRLDVIIIGSEVAKNLGYKLGDKILIAHGTDELVEIHQGYFFEITGILSKTSTAIDQSLHVNLRSLEALHDGWISEFDRDNYDSNQKNSINTSKNYQQYSFNDPKLKPSAISFILTNIKNKTEIFDVQRMVQENPGYSAVLSGVAFQEFWSLIKVSDSIISFISYLVLLFTMIAMMSSMLNTLILRKKEMVILRSLGSKPIDISIMLIQEGFINILVACVGGWLLSASLLLIAKNFIGDHFGIYLQTKNLIIVDIKTVLYIMFIGIIISIIPAISAYKKSIKQTMDES